jgi:malate dehydrogenase
MNSNAGIIKDVSSQIKQYAPDSLLLMVTNPLDVMTYIAYKVTGFNRNKVFGMSGTLDGSRARFFIAKKLGVAPSSVTPMMIGEHGDTMLPLINYTSVGGIPASKLLSKEEFSEIVNNTRHVAAEVIEKKGATIHGPAAAVNILVAAIVNDKNSVLNVSTYLDGEYGYSDVVMDVPVILGPKGVSKILELDLEPSEKAKLEESYKTLKDTNVKTRNRYHLRQLL